MQTSGKGQRYLLSTFLGITQGRGNTVEEVVNYLRRDAAADGTRPRGTIYFVENDNVRSDVRSPCFAEVAAEIQRLGVRARVIEGKLPQGAPDVMGIMAGAAQFNVAAARNVILPGAICEHLTSAGGNLRADVKQTPLTDFLRFGAAGASGTVVEPRAMQAKFPLPSLHLHYVRGCSLAEAFYQSVSGPYQLLIVGDPLCQPWAVPPTVTLDGLKPNQEVRGQLTLTPGGTAAPGRRLGRIEVTIDGRLVARTLPGQSLTLNTAKLADGYHELRVIGVHDDAIETRGRLIVPFVVKNTEAVLEVSIAPQGVVGRGSTLRISARQHGAQAIVIRQNSRELGRIEGEAGALEIPAASLGRGPTALQAISEGPMPFASKPIVIEVQ